MTTDEHVRFLIGDLLIQIAMLKAEIDTLKAKLPPPAPEPTP